MTHIAAQTGPCFAQNKKYILYTEKPKLGRRVEKITCLAV